MAQFGDHHYDIVQSSTDETGIAGDDDCATRVAFTVSMAMVDTTETANFLFERGYGQ